MYICGDGRDCAADSPAQADVHGLDKKSRKDGTRRYKCKACGRTFVLARNTVFYHAKNGLDIIRKYVEGMKEKDVLRLAAEKCSIGLKTSF